MSFEGTARYAIIGKESVAQVRWKLRHVDNVAEETKTASVDVTITIEKSDTSPNNANGDKRWIDLGNQSDSQGNDESRHSKAVKLLLDEISRFLESPADPNPVSKSKSLRFLLPSQNGYVAWSNVFAARMIDCKNVKSTVGFVDALQQVKQYPSDPNSVQGGLEGLLQYSVAGLSISTASSKTWLDDEASMTTLDKELINRLSLPWLSTSPIARTTLGLVEGGFNFDFRKRILEDAVALGIDMIIFDRAGHWLEKPEWSSLRKGFVPVDLKLNDGLLDRLVEAIEKSGIKLDGLTCFSDNYLVTAAKAAERLGLSTSSSSAYAKVVNKYECRRLATTEKDCYCVDDMEDLQRQIAESDGSRKLPCPLIVKPSVGGGSQGVTRLTHTDQLPETIARLKATYNQKVLIEPYVDGPEIDANFILQDGEVLFCEISDNLPCAGDVTSGESKDDTTPKSAADASFLETGIVFPSALDEKELQITQESLHKSLLHLGFKTGVFHVEARLRNSSMEYAVSDDGLLDLRHKKSSNSEATDEASVFLLEVNARCPGRQALCAVARTYGIDYYTIQLLFATSDAAHRAKALSQPFRNGAQYICNAVYLPATSGGVFSSPKDPFVELEWRKSDLSSYIIESHTLFQDGDEVPGPESGKLRWLATFLVASKGRDEAIMLGQQCKEEIKIEIR